MAIKVYGDKIVFPDSTEQTTASTKIDGYDKAEVDAQQKEQDDKIQANTDAIEVNAEEIEDKVSEAPTDGKPYARKNKGWHEVEGGTGDVEEAPDDGKTYGRKNEAWSEVTTDSYTKDEIDAQQLAQDDAIADNATDITQNTKDIAKNATDIGKNKTDIEALSLDIDALTGSVIYKGSLNATVTPAPADAVVGDMYINEYNVSEPATNYPVASGWSPVTEVKYDDKLIKTDTGWDLIASVVGVPSYTAGEIDALLDDKADKGDSYLKAETDALLDDKADSDLVYTKVESDAKNDEQDTAIQENKDAISALPTPVDTYTKDEIDGLQIVQDDAIQANADAIADLPTPVDAYTKTESDATNKAQDDKIQANTDSIDALPSSDDYYNKTEVDASQKIQDDVIDFKADKGDSYLKSETDTLLDNKANVGDSYTKAETYSSVEVDGELFKKADKATTYTKDEVDDLLESASDTIVGNYTNKQPASVARDPLAGNLYLSNGMSFSTDYNTVTSIYISDTDGDGDVRDFDEVEVGDKVSLTSVDGSGEYTVVTITDVGGYRELVVNTESATGTIANDTPVSIVLDVASSGSGTGGGIEEAPEDGKQYARQDGDWSEVEASGGGSTPTPEALVWEDVVADRAFNTVYTNTNDVPLYVLFYIYTNDHTISNNYANLYINGQNVGAFGDKRSGALAGDIDYSTTMVLIPAGETYELRLGGDMLISKWHEARMPLAIAIGGASSGGEIQEPVAMRASISGTSTMTNDAWQRVVFDVVEEDTNNCLNTETGEYIPNVEGYYLVSASSLMTGTGIRRGISGVWLNDDRIQQGTESWSDGNTLDSVTSNTTTIVKCNGTTDKICVKVLGRGSSPVEVTKGYGTKFNVSLITGQSTGGGSGGGGTTDILPTLYSGFIGLSGGEILRGSGGYTVVKSGTGIYEITFDTPRDSLDYVVNVTPNSNGTRTATTVNTSVTGFTLRTYNSDAPTDCTLGFTVTGTETIAVGGGSGGTSPLAMKVYVKDDITVPHDVTTVIDFNRC